MAAATPYYRVPVLIFAALVGGLYVYAKSGGALFGSGTRVTPATNAQGEELAPPHVEFMMGPKSAPAFDEIPAQPTNPSTAVLGGSKSRAVIEPSDVTLPQYGAPNNAPPTNTAPSRPPALPGSKSMILISPEALQQATQYVQPANAQPRQQQLQQPANPARNSP